MSTKDETERLASITISKEGGLVHVVTPELMQTQHGKPDS
jgi:hypothetical protein